MAYTITNSDNTVNINIPDTTVDTTYALTLIGRNVSGYGQYFVQNSIRHLENFASTVQPSGTPLTGQLWFDKGDNTFKVYSGGQWKFATNIVVSSTKPSNATSGAAHFDTNNDKLSIYDGTAWKLSSYSGEVSNAYSSIASAGNPSNYGTKLRNIFLTDSNGVVKPVLALVYVSDGSVNQGDTSTSAGKETIMSIMSDHPSFVVQAGSYPSEGENIEYYNELSASGGIGTTINPGQNLRSEYAATSVPLAERAIRADAAYVLKVGSVGNDTGANISASAVVHTGSSYNPTSSGQSLGDNNIGFETAYSAAFYSGASKIPITNNLGTPSLRFTDIYGTNLDISGDVTFGAGSQNLGNVSAPVENSFAANATVTTSFTLGSGSGYTLPVTDGSPNFALVTDGSGSVSFSAIPLTTTTFTAGDGLIGGGTLAADRVFSVGEGAFITVTADAVAVDATSTNTSGKVVVRDGSGNFAAGVITGTSLTDGTATLTSGGLSLGGAITGATGVTASGPIQFGTLSDGTISGITFVDEDNMASNSASKVPTQQSVKAYADLKETNAGVVTATANTNMKGYVDTQINALTSTVNTGTIVRTTGTQTVGGAKTFSDLTTFSDNIIVTGNLTVNGTQTQINTETLTVDDNIIVLNNNATGVPSQNAGIEVERGSHTNVLFRWNENNTNWEFTEDGTNYNVLGSASNFTGDTDGVNEGSSNLYFTNARADARANSAFDTKLAAATTADLSESGNLYYTNARADARIAAASLSSLSNVSSTAPNSNQVLQWNGTAWAPATTAAGVTDLGDLGDVNATSSNGQVLTSDGSGNFTFASIPGSSNYYLDGITKSGNTLTFSVNGTTNRTYTFGSNAFSSTTIPTNNNQLTNGAGYTTNVGDITGVTAGNGLSGGGSSGTPTLNFNGNDLTTSTNDTDGDYFVVVDTGGSDKKLTKGSIKLSGFNNDAGFVTTTGPNDNYYLNGITKSGNTLTFAVTGASNQTYTFGSNAFNSNSYYLASNPSGYTSNTGTTTASNSQNFTNKTGNISQWNNNSGYTTNVGDITSVNSVAQNGITAGGTSGGVNISMSGTYSGDFRVTGEISATADVVAYYSSDERLKDNVKVIENASDKVAQLRGVEFDWNDKQTTYEGHDVGVIAQDVEKVLPELVQTRDDGYKAVKYEKIVGLLIEAIKDLQDEVKALKGE
jgi:hypothetical protein